MKLIEVVKTIPDTQIEKNRLINIKPIIDLDKGKALFEVDLTTDFYINNHGASLMIAKTQNSIFRLNELVSVFNMNWYIPANKNHLKLVEKV